jgi:hypothetical protein
MFVPFETSFSMWFAAIPRYEWVPLVPPQPGACCPDDGACAGLLQGDAQDAAPPRLQAVFAGIDWVAYPVWRAQANPAWDLCVRNRQDEADERGQERAHHARREPPIGNTPSWGAPQSPDALPGDKLNDNNKGT